ncbi:T3SS effector HopA1 family protein [Thermopolyspora sp. NPDC052614]|uniref:T3SS effector HopA1 family protein n=1 Tax=Thermopolyspora sp. NPDC052614 TaxID=3155682 RepID=UPI003431CB48
MDQPMEQPKKKHERRSSDPGPQTGNPKFAETRLRLQAAAASWRRTFQMDMEAASAIEKAAASARQADEEKLKTIYQEYYSEGKRKTDVNLEQKDPYDLVAMGESGYLQQPTAQETIAELANAAKAGGYTLTVQGAVDQKPAHELLNDSHFVKFDNAEYPLPDNDQCQKDIARRIVVNVTQQIHGLSIAQRLLPLFTDKGISPYFRGFKVLLSTESHPVRTIHLDKIVVYYTLGKFQEAGYDVVGDRIVTTVAGAAPSEAFVSEGPLFESSVAPGIYWAEEPKYHGLQSSFSKSRSEIIKKVIANNSDVANAEEFIGLVRTGLGAGGVDPDNPHLHGKGRTRPLAPRLTGAAK